MIGTLAGVSGLTGVRIMKAVEKVAAERVTIATLAQVVFKGATAGSQITVRFSVARPSEDRTPVVRSDAPAPIRLPTPTWVR
jgi:hypothetical protein